MRNMCCLCAVLLILLSFYVVSELLMLLLLFPPLESLTMLLWQCPTNTNTTSTHTYAPTLARLLRTDAESVCIRNLIYMDNMRCVRESQYAERRHELERIYTIFFFRIFQLLSHGTLLALVRWRMVDSTRCVTPLVTPPCYFSCYF